MNKSLIKRMRDEVLRDLDTYLDSSRCFNATLLAETFINEDAPEEEDEYFDPEEEDEYFEAAFQVSEWAEKNWNLNK